MPSWVKVSAPLVEHRSIDFPAFANLGAMGNRMTIFPSSILYEPINSESPYSILETGLGTFAHPIL